MSTCSLTLTETVCNVEPTTLIHKQKCCDDLMDNFLIELSLILIGRNEKSPERKREEREEKNNALHNGHIIGSAGARTPLLPKITKMDRFQKLDQP